MSELEIKRLLNLWQELATTLAERDPKLKILIDAVGPAQPRFRLEGFEAIVCSVVGQQLAPLAAKSIVNRLRQAFPPFPTPDSFLTYSLEDLRSLGLSQRKSEYLRAISDHWVKPGWLADWKSLSDQQVVEKLTAIRGVGEWTAHMFLIFSLGRPNVLPIGDYGVRRAAQRLFELERIPEPKALRELLSHWEGAYSVGSWYLWQALNQKIL